MLFRSQPTRAQVVPYTPDSMSSGWPPAFSTARRALSPADPAPITATSTFLIFTCFSIFLCCITMRPLALFECRNFGLGVAWRNVLRAVPVECRYIDIDDALDAGLVDSQFDFGEFLRCYVLCIFDAQVA